MMQSNSVSSTCSRNTAMKCTILTGQETAQLKSAKNLFLLRIEAREGALRAGPASLTKLFAALRRIVIGDFLDPFELLHQTGLRNLHSRLVHAAVQQGDQCEGQNTGKGMDAEHVVGPKGNNSTEKLAQMAQMAQCSNCKDD